MSYSKPYPQVALLVSWLACAHAAQPADRALSPWVGRWDAVVTVNDVDVPFAFVIEADGASVSGAFFNGERRTNSTRARIDGNSVTFRFDQYATELVATLKDGELWGEYRRPRGPYPFKAARARAVSSVGVASAAPSIEGTWIIGAQSRKGETAWRFIARQRGPEVEATILRVDGDTGTLEGSWRGDRFVLSHFSGARPLLLEVIPRADGTLALKQNGRVELIGARERSDAAAAIGTPTDPAVHTRVKDPSEPFRFAFPDLSGQLVSNTDARFAGKVVLVNISGSWCPNCHDEAPFLAALHRTYRAQGLEVVTLSFEDEDQLKDPQRLRAFLETYGIEYTVLLAGTPEQLKEKVPQAVNLDAFPTTFLLGRDGRVRGVHAGFPGPGSGEFHLKVERELTATVERLLSLNF